MIEISKSPYNIKANVLGIGVADIAIISGCCDLDAIVERCFTPNLCCSSVTTNPKFLNTTFSSNIACVPIKTSISPFCNFYIVATVGGTWLAVVCKRTAYISLPLEGKGDRFSGG